MVSTRATIFDVHAPRAVAFSADGNGWAGGRTRDQYLGSEPLPSVLPHGPMAAPPTRRSVYSAAFAWRAFVAAVAAALGALSGCSAVRPPAVSEDANALAAAPLPGASMGAPAALESVPIDAAAPARISLLAPRGGAPSPTDAAVGRGPEPVVSPVSPVPPVPPGELSAAISLNLGPLGSVVTSPEERPLDHGPELQARAKLLWQAILEDKPEVAVSFFFPKDAYVHVKAAKNPEGDWRWRLWKNFERDVHAMNKTQGESLRRATFKELHIQEKKPHWAAPGNEYNRLGYWRVYGAHLVYELRGRERFLPISSLISWKREWYVVHFTGFR